MFHDSRSDINMINMHGCVHFLLMLLSSGMGSTHQDLEEYSVEEHAERRRLLLRPQGVPGATVVLPIPTKRRRELLRRSGVRDIDALEKDECESIRASRERCGCVCQGRCEPPFCLCILAGISCQVEVYSQVGTATPTKRLLAVHCLKAVIHYY